MSVRRDIPYADKTSGVANLRRRRHGCNYCSPSTPKGAWKITFLRQDHEGLRVWQEPFTKLRAPMITNLRMDPFELAHEIGMDYDRWFIEHMFAFAPAAAYVGQWLQSFREFPPRQKPGSFNLDHAMEAITSNAGKQ